MTRKGLMLMAAAHLGVLACCAQPREALTSGRYVLDDSDAVALGLASVELDLEQGLATFFLADRTVVRAVSGPGKASSEVTVDGSVPLRGGAALEMTFSGGAVSSTGPQLTFDDGWTVLELSLVQRQRASSQWPNTALLTASSPLL